MDWTDFDGDDQATLALHLVTGHGRAMPLLWLSVWKDELKDQRNDNAAIEQSNRENEAPGAANENFRHLGHTDI